ncbi:MAG TPA: patatin-like phospholipase family protein [Oligoflexus sp.]|uniref:patatin-like phospholipase family protein n=1 Tax=Oligoflexus sp. TaxID=1971216 RepID=UPI002D80389D|nr:patatin-like phospholipase family protein [Oligoflexus sp.]HET9235866.1 patatin-like phospholipase family protein [Oligoflexus sp.]
MLEFSLPGGGLWGITLTGFLYALRDRKALPEVISGVSSGNHAGYLAFSDADYQKALAWFRTSGEFLKSRPIRRFLPPYDMNGDHISSFTLPFMVDNSVLVRNGLRHFYVGYIQTKNMQFVAEDVLLYNTYEVFRTILKSSSIPFITNFVPHFGGGIDGGFAKNNFPSPVDSRERWMISYGLDPNTPLDRTIWSRRIVLPRPKGNPILLNEQHLVDNFHRGYDFGATLAGL